MGTGSFGAQGFPSRPRPVKWCTPVVRLLPELERLADLRLRHGYRTGIPAGLTSCWQDEGHRALLRSGQVATHARLSWLAPYPAGGTGSVIFSRVRTERLLA